MPLADVQPLGHIQVQLCATTFVSPLSLVFGMATSAAKRRAAARQRKRQNAQNRRQAPAAKPKPRPRPRPAAPQCNMYDTLCQQLPPSIAGLGKGTYGASSITFTHSATGGAYTAVFITNTGHSATVALQRVEASATPIMHDTTFFQPAGTAGGPTSGKPCRIGVTVRNTTKAIDRQGVVYAWVCDSRIAHDPNSSTVADLGLWAQEVANLPGVQMYSADQVANHGIHLYGFPNDQPAYESFDEWIGTENAGNFVQHIGTSGSSQPRPMSTIVLVFGLSTGTASTYEIKVDASWYHRFAVGDSRIAYQRSIPTAPAATVNAHRLQAESSGGRGWFRKTAPIKMLEAAWSNPTGRQVIKQGGMLGARAAFNYYTGGGGEMPALADQAIWVD